MRRRAIIGLGGAALMARAARATLPDRAVLLAPGPTDARLAQLATRLAEGLPPLLPTALHLSVQPDSMPLTADLEARIARDGMSQIRAGLRLPLR